MSGRVLEISKWILIVLLLGLIIYLFTSNRELESSYQAYKKDGTYINTYQSKTISELKKENRELYDSIKKLKDSKDVKQAAIISYKYKYKGETIKIDREIPLPNDSVYTFAKESDSISYSAKVKSQVKPEWVAVDITLKDKITIINKEKDGKNETTITTSTSGGTIDDAYFFNKDTKKDSFFNRFSVGLTIGAGYGITSRTPDIFIGVGVNFRLNKLK